MHQVLLSKASGGAELRLLAREAVQLVSQDDPILLVEPELREEKKRALALPTTCSRDSK